ncbi:MAG TPA: hypothetical protein VGV40_11890 [Solirubrobacteraceae bacterium]|nr:hypothetical protein [Solirubrobacteraceae bacterium]
MSRTRLPILIAALTALAVPATASAEPVSALDDAVVWVSGEFGEQTLMQRAPDGRVSRVPGAPTARAYRSIDLGRDAKNRLVLTYLRCDADMDCVARRDDLKGRRASIRGIVPRGCSLTTAPALWRTRTAYALSCRTQSRSGLFVRTSSGSIRRMALPADARRAGADEITHVDLRGTDVAAVAADIYEYAFAQRVNRSRMRSFLAAASEGESDAHVRGLALGAGGALWALANTEAAGDPRQSIIYRLEGSCRQFQRLVSTDPPTDPQADFPASGLGVDHRTVHLSKGDEGVVEHDFAPDFAC